MATWLVAADAANGGERWRVAVGAEGPMFPPRPAVADGLVFAPADDGLSVAAFDAATGAERWRVGPLGGAPVNFAPSVAVGLVVAAARYALYGLDAATGQQRWAHPPYAPEVRREDGLLLFAERPVVTADGIYCVVNSGDGGDRELLAVDTATGRELWRAATSTGLPVAAGDVVYAIDDNGALLTLDAASGTERWRLPVGGLPLA